MKPMPAALLSPALDYRGLRIEQIPMPEPGTGEIAYHWLLPHVDAFGYDGWIGCEYRPAGDTVAGLGWAADYLTPKGSRA